MASPCATSKFGRRYTKAKEDKEYESNSDIDDEHQSSSSRNQSNTKSQSTTPSTLTFEEKMLNTLDDTCTVGLVDFGIPQHDNRVISIDKMVKYGESFSTSGNEIKVGHSHEPTESQSRVHLIEILTVVKDKDPKPDTAKQFWTLLTKEYQIELNNNYLKYMMLVTRFYFDHLQQNTKTMTNLFGTSKSKNCESNATFIAW